MYNKILIEPSKSNKVLIIMNLFIFALVALILVFGNCKCPQDLCLADEVYDTDCEIKSRYLGLFGIKYGPNKKIENNHYTEYNPLALQSGGPKNYYNNTFRYITLLFFSVGLTMFIYATWRHNTKKENENHKLVKWMLNISFIIFLSILIIYILLSWAISYS